jgi:hypothetical protein
MQFCKELGIVYGIEVLLDRMVTKSKVTSREQFLKWKKEFDLD